MAPSSSYIEFSDSYRATVNTFSSVVASTSCFIHLLSNCFDISDIVELLKVLKKECKLVTVKAR